MGWSLSRRSETDEYEWSGCGAICSRFFVAWDRGISISWATIQQLQNVTTTRANDRSMTRDLYVRPIGLTPTVQRGDEQGGAGLSLAGGWLEFMGLEAIERSGPGRRRARVFDLGEYCERDWGQLGMAAAELFEGLRQPRPRIAGLALDRPRIMGIVNVTPDSFSDGGRWAKPEAAIEHALRLVEEGADILDLGAESTRPGSDPVSVEEELIRLMPVIEGLAGRTRALISIDTRNAEVMRRAADAGADILNDVSALTHDPDALDAAAESGLPVVLMHSLGDPKTMQRDPRYDDVVLDVFDYLEERVGAAEAAGIDRSRLILDPAIGFGKTLQHNLALMAETAMLHALGLPILIGVSRKRFIGTLTGVEQPADRVFGSIGAALAAVGQGAQIIRVHDVAATKQALTMWEASVAGAKP